MIIPYLWSFFFVALNVTGYKHFFKLSPSKKFKNNTDMCCKLVSDIGQRTLPETEGSVQFTSSLR